VITKRQNISILKVGKYIRNIKQNEDKFGKYKIAYRTVEFYRTDALHELETNIVWHLMERSTRTDGSLR